MDFRTNTTNLTTYNEAQSKLREAINALHERKAIHDGLVQTGRGEDSFDAIRNINLATSLVLQAVDHIPDQ